MLMWGVNPSLWMKPFVLRAAAVVRLRYKLNYGELPSKTGEGEGFAIKNKRKQQRIAGRYTVLAEGMGPRYVKVMQMTYT